MNSYLLVIYNNKTKEVRNKEVTDISQASAIHEFLFFKNNEEVLLNILELN